MYIYVYICIYMYIYVYICIYMYNILKYFFQLNSVITCYVCVQFIYIYIYLYMFCVE